MHATDTLDTQARTRLRLEELRLGNSFAALPDVFHARVPPTPLEQPHLVSYSAAAAELIDLDPAECARPEFLDWFSGRRLPPGADPVAMRYSGHQFGHYVPQLGDGRAIILGELRNRAGEPWEIQLKGAGRTPYSRDGDGRAVLRSTLREYLASEAMAALGIPTTRALAMIGSPEEVYRERIETGAILVRLAPTHVRFGSFEVLYYDGQHDALRRLADYVIERHYPALHEASNPYLALYREIIGRTARLIAQWQLVGFTHGVMNTDNMSVLGLTLDYGPYGFLDRYQSDFVCNHTDRHGRYAFDRQPDIGLWNLSCLGQALLPLLDADPQRAADQATAEFETYQGIFADSYAAGLRAKLGLREGRAGDDGLADRLLSLMARDRADYTLTFRTLCDFDSRDDADHPGLRERFVDQAALSAWMADYRARLRAEGSGDAERARRMRAVNPRYILRNHLAQQAIEQAERGDYGEIERLLAVLSRPYDEQPGMEAYAAEPPPWAADMELSCSS